LPPEPGRHSLLRLSATPLAALSRSGRAPFRLLVARQCRPLPTRWARLLGVKVQQRGTP